MASSSSLSSDPRFSGSDPIIERVSEQCVHDVDDDDDSFLAVEREVPEL